MPPHEPETPEPSEHPEPELPTSLVPRWLALLVLAALLASAGFSVFALLR